MNTHLDPSFLTAVLLMNSFRHRPMVMAQAALLHMALRGEDFDASMLPGEVTQGSKHIAGAATGALISQGLIIVTRRIKSPRPEARGRKLDVLRLAPGKRGTAITWLKANDLPTPEAVEQMGLAI